MSEKKITETTAEKPKAVSDAAAKKPVKKAKKPLKPGAFLRSRRAKKGGAAILLTALVIAAVIILNIVTTMLVEKVPSLSFDMTGGDVFEPQQESIDYVRDLKKDVNIFILRGQDEFEQGGEYYVQAEKLIEGLERYADRIRVKYVDLNSNPTFTTPYTDVDWTQSHLILVESGGNYRALDAEDLFDYNQEYLYYYGSYVIEGQHVEQAVITAILNVTTEEKVKVTVLSGQGEESCEAFQTLLKNNAYEIEEISLLSGEIAVDSQFVIIYDPATDIDDEVYETLTTWLYNDGKYGHTLVYLPNDQVDVKEFANLNSLLEEWGMQVGYGYIFETDANHMTNSQDPTLISIYDYNIEEYTEKLKTDSIPTVLFYTMPIEILDENIAQALLVSSDKAVILPKDADESWDYKNEPTGTRNGAVIATQGTDDAQSHVLVIGSYDAWTSSSLSAKSFNNAEFFLSVFNTIAARDEIGITIEGKNMESNELGATSAASTAAVGILVRFVIPAIILIFGLVVWLRRRNK